MIELRLRAEKSGKDVKEGKRALCPWQGKRKRRMAKWKGGGQRGERIQ